jgi:hypothetical protein
MRVTASKSGILAECQYFARDAAPPPVVVCEFCGGNHIARDCGNK